MKGSLSWRIHPVCTALNHDRLEEMTDAHPGSYSSSLASSSAILMIRPGGGRRMLLFFLAVDGVFLGGVDSFAAPLTGDDDEVSVEPPEGWSSEVPPCDEALCG